MDKKKENESTKTKIPWWVALLLVLLAIYYFSNYGRVDDYSYCVSDCSFDLSGCLDYPSYLSDSCIQDSDVAECVDELESCLADCEID